MARPKQHQLRNNELVSWQWPYEHDRGKKKTGEDSARGRATRYRIADCTLASRLEI